MSIVTYTAARSIISGHTLGNVYSLTIPLVSAEPTGQINKIEQVALNPTIRESLFWGKRLGLAIVIGHYAEVGTDIDAVKEFLDSVETGAPFLFDQYGTDSPPAQRWAVMVGTYQEIRHARQRDSASDIMRFSFSIEFV